MSDRIYLRAFEPDDYKVSIKWRKDDEIWSMLGGSQHFVSEAFEKKWIENAIFDNKDIKLAICLNKTDLYIGNIYITNLDYINRSCESHILIGNRDYWGKGYALESLRRVLDFVFKERGMNRVEAKILETNVASIRMHEKCGYKKEGLMRNSVFKNGRYVNQLVLSILCDEYYSTENK